MPPGASVIWTLLAIFHKQVHQRLALTHLLPQTCCEKQPARPRHCPVNEEHAAAEGRKHIARATSCGLPRFSIPLAWLCWHQHRLRAPLALPCQHGRHQDQQEEHQCKDWDHLRSGRVVRHHHAQMTSASWPLSQHQRYQSWGPWHNWRCGALAVHARCTVAPCRRCQQPPAWRCRRLRLLRSRPASVDEG